MTHNRANGRGRAWTLDDALAAGRRWVEAYGVPPTREELNPAKLRLRIRRQRAKLARLEERAERFETGEMPGAEVVSRLFGGMDSYLHALGFTPRGRGRPPQALARRHATEARALVELAPQHWALLGLLDRVLRVPEDELRYQWLRRHREHGQVDSSLDELEAAGMVRAVITFELTDEGKAVLRGRATA